LTDFGKRSGILYLDRGDPSRYDYSLTDFTTDGNWHDLDLSAIMPFVNILIKMFVMINDNASETYLMFRRKGNSNSFNIHRLRISVANISTSQLFEIMCDKNGKIEYKATDTTFASIDLTVCGWFI
jgi:hypothetical protein